MGLLNAVIETQESGNSLTSNQFSSTLVWEFMPSLKGYQSQLLCESMDYSVAQY